MPGTPKENNVLGTGSLLKENLIEDPPTTKTDFGVFRNKNYVNDAFSLSAVRRKVLIKVKKNFFMPPLMARTLELLSKKKLN